MIALLSTPFAARPNMLVKDNLRQYYTGLFRSYQEELELAVGDSRSLLDVGCGISSPVKRFSHKLFTVGVDAFLPCIEKSKEECIHTEYVQAQVLDILRTFGPNSFDCVLASDLIEHLAKEEGLQLLEQMEAIAKKRILVFTPNGFVHQGAYDGNPWQVHRSGWGVGEMQERGYRVVGISGLKMLRGERAEIRWRPRLLWRPISDVSQLVVRQFPRLAFQMLCVKNLESTD